MYKVLIVEDEELERTSLEKVIAEYCPVIREIDTADNGDSALESVQAGTPDIVLMDIHLGSANGLDLSDVILREYPTVKIIVITAYDQFSYVQRALKIGVSDYILKPVSTDALIKIIEKQISVIEKEKWMVLRQARQDDINETAEELVRTAFVGNIIHNTINENMVDSLSTIQYPRKSMAVCVMDFVIPGMTLIENDRTAVKKILFDFLMKREYKAKLVGDVFHSNFITLCLFSEDPDENWAWIARQIRHDVAAEYHIFLEMGISDKTSDIYKLGGSFKQAMLALKVGKDSINLYTDHFADYGDSFSEADGFLAEIIPYMLDGRLPELESAFERMQTELIIREESLSGSKIFCSKLWISLIKELESKISLKQDEYEKLFLSTILHVMNTSSIQDSVAIVKESVLEATGFITSVRGEKLYHITKRAHQYIDEHFTEPLTLNSIADALKISSYYLSHVFKESFGSTIMEYLGKKRIEESRKLLIESDLSVKEIATAVGYSDANYFCRVFKKYSNLTPSNYREANKGLT
ncbi:hypothetical protein AGMMS49983_20850 [Clostridia bacterium]|nr:hypothetical protein AGMMS49983_20850 [Clostridia bacterium]